MVDWGNLPEHSPLGASGAYRWMPCPGSVGLSHGVEDEESDFAFEGTAAHKVAEHCLTTKEFPWQQIGKFYAGDKLYRTRVNIELHCLEVNKDMADAAQVYLDALDAWHPDRHQGNSWVERAFHCPSIHPLFYGKADFVHLDGRTLHVWDYKHGAGIVVEATNNPQLKYYAIGVLEDLDLWEQVDEVVLHIAQPRGFHFAGPIRQWSTTPSELEDWLIDELVPAMENALVSTETKSGEHCRFCPARSRACPTLMKEMKEFEDMLEMIKGTPADELKSTDLARFLTLLKRAKLVQKAAEKTAFQRLNAGKPVPGFKLGPKRTNREWKDEKKATAALKRKFGAKAYTEPVLKSPAQIDAMPEGETMTTKLAHKPNGGLTVLEAGDARPEVSRNTKSMFTPVKKGK